MGTAKDFNQPVCTGLGDLSLRDSSLRMWSYNDLR